jgi:peptide-methionine (S)-S-oxide reductase
VNPSPEKTTLRQAYFGGGCFWCTEAQFKLLPGVVDVVSGYAGGSSPDPSYEAVCRGKSGHAEIIQIHYRPDLISYEDLLDKFWITHDPTTLNRQGHDVGTQYRSVIFYGTDEEKKAAQESLARAQADFADPIVTELSPLQKFYPAETYHQDFFTRNPQQGYCLHVVAPKVAKFKSHLSQTN